MYWEFFCSLMNIHGIFNGDNVTQKDALLYETQLDDSLHALNDILEYLNQSMSYKITGLFQLGNSNAQSAAENVKAAHSKREFCQLLRDFLESMGGSVANLGVTCMIWDCIFLKYMGNRRSLKTELYLAFAILLCAMSDDLLSCSSPSEFVLTIRANMTDVQPYDFYLIYVEAHRKEVIPQLKNDVPTYDSPRVQRRPSMENPLNEQFDQPPYHDQPRLPSHDSMRSSKSKIMPLPEPQPNPNESINRPPSKQDVSDKDRMSEEGKQPEAKVMPNDDLSNINEDDKEAEGSEGERVPISFNKGTLVVPDVNEYDIFAGLNI